MYCLKPVQHAVKLALMPNLRRKPNLPTKLVLLHCKSSLYCIKTLAVSCIHVCWSHWKVQTRTHYSYITQVTWTTNFVYNKYSHGKKAKTRIFKGPSPSNSWKTVLHGFRHSTLTVPLFQEDPGFCSAETIRIWQINVYYCFKIQGIAT